MFASLYKMQWWPESRAGCQGSVCVCVCVLRTWLNTICRVCHWLVISRDLVVTLAYITGLVPPGRRVRARPTQSCMDASFPRLQRARAGHQDYSRIILLRWVCPNTTEVFKTNKQTKNYNLALRLLYIAIHLKLIFYCCFIIPIKIILYIFLWLWWLIKRLSATKENIHLQNERHQCAVSLIYTRFMGKLQSGLPDRCDAWKHLWEELRRKRIIITSTDSVISRSNITVSYV